MTPEYRPENSVDTFYTPDQKIVDSLVEDLVTRRPVLAEKLENYKKDRNKDTCGELFYHLCFAEYLRLRMSNFEQDEESLSKAWSYAATDSTVEHSTASNSVWAVNGTTCFSYKFGNPSSVDSPNKRRDAVSLYFDEKPTPEDLQRISEVITPYVRDNSELLGTKVSDGFFMSDVGIISNKHSEQFITTMDDISPGLSEAVYLLCSHGSGWGISEGIYVAMKNVFKEIGVDISYDSEHGFTVAVKQG